MATSLKELVAEFEDFGGLGVATEDDHDRMTEDQARWLEKMEQAHGDARVGWDCQNLLIVTWLTAAYVDADGMVETADLRDSRLSVFRMNAEQAWKRAQAELTADLERDPVAAFQWLDRKVAAAARYHVWSHVLEWVKDGRSPEQILAGLREETLRRARCPERSTSAAHNLMGQALTEAWGKAAEYLERMT